MRRYSINSFLASNRLSSRRVFFKQRKRWMPLFKFDKKKDRFEIYIFGLKLTFYRYLRMIRETYLMLHYSLLKDSLKSRYNISLPKDSYYYLPNHVELVEVALKDIRKLTPDRKKVPITETAVYKNFFASEKNPYLCLNEADIYVSPKIKNSKLKIENLEKTMKNGYDISKAIIVLKKDNTLIDGYHRCAALYHKFGGDHKILVIREK